MVKTPYWTLERDIGASYFRLRRTATRFESPESMGTHARTVERALSKGDMSRLGVLVDLRLGPMRNDPEFESAARQWQGKLVETFGKIAFLVATPVGKLQMNRIARLLSKPAQVFDDEAAAVAWLAAKQ